MPLVLESSALAVCFLGAYGLLCWFPADVITEFQKSIFQSIRTYVGNTLGLVKLKNLKDDDITQGPGWRLMPTAVVMLLFVQASTNFSEGRLGSVAAILAGIILLSYSMTRGEYYHATLVARTAFILQFIGIFMQSRNGGVGIDDTTIQRILMVRALSCITLMDRLDESLVQQLGYCWLLSLTRSMTDPMVLLPLKIWLVFVLPMKCIGIVEWVCLTPSLISALKIPLRPELFLGMLFPAFPMSLGHIKNAFTFAELTPSNLIPLVVNGFVLGGLARYGHYIDRMVHGTQNIDEIEKPMDALSSVVSTTKLSQQDKTIAMTSMLISGAFTVVAGAILIADLVAGSDARVHVQCATVIATFALGLGFASLFHFQSPFRRIGSEDSTTTTSTIICVSSFLANLRKLVFLFQMLVLLTCIFARLYIANIQLEFTLLVIIMAARILSAFDQRRFSYSQLESRFIFILATILTSDMSDARKLVTIMSSTSFIATYLVAAAKAYPWQLIRRKLDAHGFLSHAIKQKYCAVGAAVESVLESTPNKVLDHDRSHMLRLILKACRNGHDTCHAVNVIRNVRLKRYHDGSTITSKLLKTEIVGWIEIGTVRPEKISFDSALDENDVELELHWEVLKAFLVHFSSIYSRVMIKVEKDPSTSSSSEEVGGGQVTFKVRSNRKLSMDDILNIAAIAEVLHACRVELDGFSVPIKTMTGSVAGNAAPRATREVDVLPEGLAYATLDDNELVRRSVKRTIETRLKGSERSFYRGRTEEECRQFADEVMSLANVVDICLIDENLENDIFGTQVARELREKGYQGCILLHSASTLSTDRTLDPSFDGMVEKTTSRDEFVQGIARGWSKYKERLAGTTMKTSVQDAGEQDGGVVNQLNSPNHDEEEELVGITNRT